MSMLLTIVESETSADQSRDLWRHNICHIAALYHFPNELQQNRLKFGLGLWLSSSMTCMLDIWWTTSAKEHSNDVVPLTNVGITSLRMTLPQGWEFDDGSWPLPSYRYCRLYSMAKWLTWLGNAHVVESLYQTVPTPLSVRQRASVKLFLSMKVVIRKIINSIAKWHGTKDASARYPILGASGAVSIRRWGRFRLLKHVRLSNKWNSIAHVSISDIPFIW